MTVKPLNLSILIGDMNPTIPHNSPRTAVISNKKSRIPLATSPNIPGIVPEVVSKGVTRFRQWADPPPPPSRSRTSERKSSLQKRPGSADPRFRRTLGSLKVNNNGVPVEDAMFMNKSSSVTNLTCSNKKENDEYFLPPAEEYKNVPNKRILDFLEDSVQSMNLNNSEMLNLGYNLDNSNNVRLMESNLVLDSEAPNKELALRKIFPIQDDHIQTDSKYSQTDIYSNIYSDLNDTAELEMAEENSDIIHYITSQYEKTARCIDDLILNRTRSISTIYELGRIKEIRQPKILKSLSRIILSNNYWMYLELAGALAFFIGLLIFGWYYLLPYLEDAFYTWIYPTPLTAQDYFKKSVGDVISSTTQTLYNLLTAPANRRMP